MTKSVRSLAKLRLVVHWLIPTKGTDPAASRQQSSQPALPCPACLCPAYPCPASSPLSLSCPCPCPCLWGVWPEPQPISMIAVLTRQQGLGDGEAAFLRPGLLPSLPNHSQDEEFPVLLTSSPHLALSWPTRRTLYEVPLKGTGMGTDTQSRRGREAPAG